MGRVPTDKFGGCIENVAGEMIARNPGVTALATIKGKARWFRDGPGVLFRVDPIERCVWYAHGRLATRAEVAASFDSWLPILLEMATKEGPDAVVALSRQEAKARALFPVEA
jgi:hypothetical protein